MEEMLAKSRVYLDNREGLYIRNGVRFCKSYYIMFALYSLTYICLNASSKIIDLSIPYDLSFLPFTGTRSEQLKIHGFSRVHASISTIL